jgi:hypothetical protein
MPRLHGCALTVQRRGEVSRQEAVEHLLNAAFKELQHDTGPLDVEYVHQRAVLSSEFHRILRAFASDAAGESRG